LLAPPEGRYATGAGCRCDDGRLLLLLPTDYRGLAELGEIAGVGMLIAFATSVTVLPALLAIIKPPGEPHSIGFAALAPADRFLERHRVPVVIGTILVVGSASPLLSHLQFDFDPMHLRNATVESVQRIMS
jgi:predicted RND superfamily exporter protein